MKVNLHSSLSPADCARRLRQHVSSEWSLITESGIVGTVDGDNFMIRKKIYYRNSFQRRLHGQLSNAPNGGTRIHGETRERDFKWIFVLAGIVAAIASCGLAFTLFQHRAELHDLPIAVIIGPLLVVPLLTGIMVGAVAFGRRLGRSNEPFLLDFLCRTLDAKPE